MSKKKLQGKAIKDAVNKTVVVLVESYKKHPKYKKYIKRSKKYKAHDEENISKAGEKIVIEECRPMSRHKSFKVIAKI